MRFKNYLDPHDLVPDGYVTEPHDFDIEEKDLRNGFCAYPGLDLNDMFGAFERTQNYGLVGGDRTVDDYTPEGVETQIGGASGHEGRVQHEPGAHRDISHYGKSGAEDEPGHKYP